MRSNTSCVLIVLATTCALSNVPAAAGLGLRRQHHTHHHNLQLHHERQEGQSLIAADSALLSDSGVGTAMKCDLSEDGAFNLWHRTDGLAYATEVCHRLSIWGHYHCGTVIEDDSYWIMVEATTGGCGGTYHNKVRMNCHKHLKTLVPKITSPKAFYMANTKLRWKSRPTDKNTEVSHVRKAVEASKNLGTLVDFAAKNEGEPYTLASRNCQTVAAGLYNVLTNSHGTVRNSRLMALAKAGKAVTPKFFSRSSESCSSDSRGGSRSGSYSSGSSGSHSLESSQSLDSSGSSHSSHSDSSPSSPHSSLSKPRSSGGGGTHGKGTETETGTVTG